jgi:hypothetical protein
MRPQARASAHATQTLPREGDGIVPVTPLSQPIQLAIVFTILVVDFGAIIYCLTDLYKPERRVNGYSKDVWALIILFGNIFGLFFYLRYGRETP